VFEIGAVYRKNAAIADGPLSVAGYEQTKRLAAIAYGFAAEEQWGVPKRNVDFFDIKADLEALFAPATLQFTKLDHPALHPGRSADVLLDGKSIGVIGELHPRWQQKYDLPLAPVLFEVDVAVLQARAIPAYAEISKFPAVSRDLALVIKQSVQAQDLINTFVIEKKTNAACKIMQAIVLFDEYRGAGLENDEKSLAFRFTLQDTQTTLHDDQVNAAMEAFKAIAAEKHGAKIR